MTVDDILYTFKERHEGGLGARSAVIGDFWVGKKGGSQKIIDDFTVAVDTGDPWLPARAFDFMRGLGGVSTSIVSKNQSEELTPEDASKDPSGAKSTDHTAPPCCIVAMHRIESMSHSLTVPSSEPETSVRPSGANSTASTSLSCPAAVAMQRPEARSHSLIVRSLLQEATSFPAG